MGEVSATDASTSTQRWDSASHADPPAPKRDRPPGWDVDDRRIPDAVRNYDPAMFKNPALLANAGAAPPPCAALAIPPAKPLPPGIPPTAPNAYHGIQLKCLAEDLPHVSRTATERQVIVGPYKLFPAVARQPDNSEAVVFFTAYNTLTKRAEFIVGPDDLARFASEPLLFQVAAANAYAHGEPNKWELESMKTVDAAMRKGPLAAVGHLGAAWLEAVKDPDWWMQNAAASGAFAEAAESGAAARAGRVPASEIGKSTPIVEGGGLAAHEGGPRAAHTIGKHVGLTDAQLVERANTPRPSRVPGKPPGPPPSSASTFYDRTTAEVAASRTLAANDAAVREWLAKGAPRTLVIEDAARGAPVGRLVQRYGSAAKDVAGTRLILIGDPSKSCGFRILTGHPIE
jgi:hypothetical protein